VTGFHPVEAIGIADCRLRIADCGLRIADWNAKSTGTMNAEIFKKRTKAYALRVMHVVESLPDTRTGRVISNQLLRCSTSVGANYRAAARAKSQADFISKMGTVEEESDESLYWMELLIESGLAERECLADLMAEGNEILAMVVSSIRTARVRRNE